MLKKLAVLTLFISSTIMAKDLPKELYMPNDADGFIVLTVEECKIPAAAKLGFHWRAYATEGKEEKIMHEGCWDRPDTSDAPRIQGVKIIPLVNTLWETGDLATFQASQFGPEKKRWDVKLPEIQVKPTL